MTEPKNKDVYNATIKLFGSHPEPPFEDPGRLEALWGRRWGCDNDVGQIRAVLMHRPGDEFNVIDPAKRIEEIGSFGDLDAGWYWQSETIPPLAEMQAQHDGLANALRAEGAEVIYLEGVDGGRFKSVYTRDSSFAVRGGAIVTRLAPRMRHGEELAVTRTLAGLGMPILRTVHGTGMLEGGSFAWLNAKTAVVGRGIRVNDEGIAQVAEVLKVQGVELIVVDLRGYDIHIDGHFLMVDVDLALIWARGLPFSFLERLKELGIRTIEMTPEDNSWIVNGLAVRPGRVLMPEGISDRTREALDRHGVEIVTLPYDKVQLNGGGIHCSTCPLIRDPVA
jgi:N-dimethylarginine dimethylaminohydrolase